MRCLATTRELLGLHEVTSDDFCFCSRSESLARQCQLEAKKNSYSTNLGALAARNLYKGSSNGKIASLIFKGHYGSCIE